MSWHLGVIGWVGGIRKGFVQEALPGLEVPTRAGRVHREPRVRPTPISSCASPGSAAVYAELAQRRRRAQIAARHLLASLDAC